MEIKDVQAAVEEGNRAFESFKHANDLRLDKLEKDRGVADLDEKLEKIGTALDSATEMNEKFITEQTALEEKVKDLEAELEMGLTREGKGESRAEIAYKSAFDRWIRACGEDSAPPPEMTKELHTLEREMLEKQYPGVDIKAITGAAGASGGAAIPTELARIIHDQTRLQSPFLDLVTVREIGTRNYSEIMNIHGEDSGWVAEDGTRSETQTSTFRTITPTMGTLYAYPKASEESIDDVFFDVGGFLADVTANEFAIAIGQAILDGDGTAKPTGLLDATPVTTNDDASPPRAAAALEYVPLTTASPVAGIQADELITLQYNVRAPYRQNATWTMNSVVVGAVRKLKGSDNNYLWQPGLQAGAPSVLLGRPVRVMENMAGLTADAFPIMFGDFKRGYLYVNRVGLRVTVDDNLTTPGQVKWYIRRRAGGIVLDNNAIKLGKYANS